MLVYISLVRSHSPLARLAIAPEQLIRQTAGVKVRNNISYHVGLINTNKNIAS
jgi:hypothetical protein